MTDSLSPPLWRQLQAASQALAAVHQGRSLTDALQQVTDVPRPGVQALAFEALRHWGRALALRQQLAPRAPAPRADALLCLALALLSSDGQAGYADHTLVDQTAEAAKRASATRHQAGFINACLRRLLREREALMRATDADSLARWNHPGWWVQRLQADHPDHWQAILTQDQQRAPLTLRVNERRCTPEAYQALLAQAGLAARRIGRAGLVLDEPVPVQSLPHFAEGWVAVQDAAAQLAAPLLLDGLAAGQPGSRLRLLDACAAPGGKTAHLLEMADADVTALEVDAGRARRIHENLDRLGLSAHAIVVADAAEVAPWWDGQPFDGILLDAPCSASGIVRRHPDIAWLRRASDIAQLATIQHRLLERLWPLVRPGGRLLYCTCSVFRAEGEDQRQAFLAHNSDARALPAPGHLLPPRAQPGLQMTDNGPREHDGFYYALLEKMPA
ncbi:MAG: Ribosomal RNA small subunit methyltransferase B [Paracidovorax wautersii]|uniref:Ribosomal RNA small subunit methyltransferase B n=1 Tax=Paracidovorax wautersii TaxID=1177982 RepID=A0A7V8FLC8_9BURK|nr:MAG: Ribosomal RNA small subunit methyltransferase B [Paracidovorax wautersii]